MRAKLQFYENYLRHRIHDVLSVMDAVISCTEKMFGQKIKHTEYGIVDVRIWTDSHQILIKCEINPGGRFGIKVHAFKYDDISDDPDWRDPNTLVYDLVQSEVYYPNIDGVRHFVWGWLSTHAEFHDVIAEYITRLQSIPTTASKIYDICEIDEEVDNNDAQPD